MQREDKQDNSRLFNLERSEEINVADLNLFDKNTRIPTKEQKTFVANLDQESRPIGVVLKPYVDGFLKGAGYTAEAMAGYGQYALKTVSGVIWWGYEGIKSLFSKTTEFIKPKFVLLTHKKDPNQEQLNLINKLQRDKQMAVLGINQLNELKHIDNGRCQVVMPADAEFMEYLRNQKFIIREKDWATDVDPTKTIMMPSQSFSVLVNNFETAGVKQELPRREIINYGQFCAFELEGKNQIEYQFLEKLRMSKDHLEGFMVRTAEVEKQSSSNDSRPDYEGLLIVDEVPENNLADNPVLTEKPKVTVKQVPLINNTSEQYSREVQLN